MPPALGLALAAAAVAGALSAAGAPAPAKPTLRLLDVRVPTFLGTGFRPREHVRLEVVGGGRHVVFVTAGAGGSFTKKVAGVNPGNCTGFSVIATGDHGSRATLKRPPGVCAPPS